MTDGYIYRERCITILTLALAHSHQPLKMVAMVLSVVNTDDHVQNARLASPSLAEEENLLPRRIKKSFNTATSIFHESQLSENHQPPKTRP
jgi:hypothetical protein